jgi:hypothetical protein
LFSDFDVRLSVDGQKASPLLKGEKRSIEVKEGWHTFLVSSVWCTGELSLPIGEKDLSIAIKRSVPESYQIACLSVLVVLFALSIFSLIPVAVPCAIWLLVYIPNLLYFTVWRKKYFKFVAKRSYQD